MMNVRRVARRIRIARFRHLARGGAVIIVGGHDGTRRPRARLRHPARRAKRD